jgi:hypothetical protein
MRIKHEGSVKEHLVSGVRTFRPSHMCPKLPPGQRVPSTETLYIVTKWWEKHDQELEVITKLNLRIYDYSCNSDNSNVFKVPRYPHLHIRTYMPQDLNAEP